MELEMELVDDVVALEEERIDAAALPVKAEFCRLSCSLSTTDSPCDSSATALYKGVAQRSKGKCSRAVKALKALATKRELVSPVTPTMKIRSADESSFPTLFQSRMWRMKHCTPWTKCWLGC